MHEEVSVPQAEQPGYWREYFINRGDPNSLGFAMWRNLFDDSELGELITLPGESLDQANLRHQRKLHAMLSALEELQLPEQEWLVTRLRRELKLQSL